MQAILSKPCGVVAARPPMPSRRAASKRSSVVAHAAMPEDPALWDTQETDAQIFDRVVKVVKAKDLKTYAEKGWTVLDVRPPDEARKVHLNNAVEIPLWVPDNGMDPFSLFKRASAFGMAGWWLGAHAMVPNDNFLSEVEAKIPKDSKVLLACQKGIRSKDAAQQLARAGYTQLAWVEGGLNTSKLGEVPTLDGADIRLAGIGGISALIHWTELQQENAGPLGGWRTALAIVGAIWLVNILTLSIELRPLFEHLKETGAL